MFPCLIIVARDAPDLLDAWVALYGQTDGVEIRFDQRQGLPWIGPGDPPDRRAQPTRDTDLKDHAFIVIPRP